MLSRLDEEGKLLLFDDLAVQKLLAAMVVVPFRARLPLSDGFHFGQTGIHDPDRLDRLVLMIVLVCWRVSNLGIWLHRMGCPEVDRTGHLWLCLFQLGLRYINRLLHIGEILDVKLVPTLVGAE